MEIDQKDEDWKIFIHKMTKKEITLKLLLTGSFAEMEHDDYNSNPSDMDLMSYVTNVIGVATKDDGNALVTKSFKGLWIKHTENHPQCHPGFTRIESRDYDYMVKFFSTTNFIVKGSGPAMKIEKSWMHQILETISIKGIDIIFCIQCYGWPITAAKWISRDRISDWPNDDLVKDVVAGGYHLVDKKHPWHPVGGKEVFWRISFSRAECLLMMSLNRVQKRIYALLRKIKTIVVQECRSENDSVLCTYFFKTAMLWMCEEKPKEFWEEENIPNAVKEILSKIIVWLIDRNCPNYFIPENNMLDHLPDDFELEREITALTYFAESDWSVIEDRLMDNNVYRMPLDAVQRTMVAANRSLTASFGVEFEGISPVLSTEHDQNVTDIFESETFKEKIKIFGSESDDTKVLFQLHRILCQWDQDVSLNSAECKFTQLAGTSFELCQNKRHDIELLKIIEDSTHGFELISRSDAINLALTNVKNGNIFVIQKTLFVVCAYLANYYYAVEKDYDSSMLISQTVIDAFTSDICRIAISELAFPVLLSSRWSKLFDENVRSVHGFLMVFHSVNAENQYQITETDRHSMIKFCAMLFLRYIKVQLEIKCGDDIKVQRAVQDFYSHLEHVCPSDRHNWTVADELSRRFLEVSIRNSLAESNKLWILERRVSPAPNINPFSAGIDNYSDLFDTICKTVGLSNENED